MHTPGPWSVASDSNGSHEVVRNNPLLRETRAVAFVYRVDEQGLNDARLIAASPDLHAYAKCEEARLFGEDVAETVLKQYGWNPSVCTSHEFMDKMRRAALAKVGG